MISVGYDLLTRGSELVPLQTSDIEFREDDTLRVGAAQDLLSAGYDTAAIMRAGGWKSINVLGCYLEFAEHNVWG
jgi:integrase/recombinase XerD